MPLVKKFDAAVVAISNDETGISEDPDERFKVAKKIVERAQDFGIKAEGRRGRSLGDADWCPGQRRGGRIPFDSAPARGARRQHHLVARPMFPLVCPTATV